MNNYCVYKHTSPSGKVYIGITSISVNKRWGKDGKGYAKSPKFYLAIEKYGWDNIKHEILFTHLSKEEACAKEIELIAQYNSTNGSYGYNCLSGGNFPTFDEESRKKMSDSRNQYVIENGTRKHTEESKKKMSDAVKARLAETGKRTLSEETKAKISLSLAGKKKPPRSEQSRKNMSEAKKNISEETRKKMSSSKKNMSDETKKKMSYAKKEYWKNKKGNTTQGEINHE